MAYEQSLDKTEQDDVSERTKFPERMHLKRPQLSQMRMSICPVFRIFLTVIPMMRTLLWNHQPSRTQKRRVRSQMTMKTAQKLIKNHPGSTAIEFSASQFYF
jgi:hypothetical protein